MRFCGDDLLGSVEHDEPMTRHKEVSCCFIEENSFLIIGLVWMTKLFCHHDNNQLRKNRKKKLFRVFAISLFFKLDCKIEKKTSSQKKRVIEREERVERTS